MRKFLFLVLAGLMVSPVGAETQKRTTADKIVVGNGANTDKSIIFNKGSGSTNPALKYDSTKGKISFSNDGVVFKDIGSGSGGDGRNFIASSDGTSTSGWVGYTDAAGSKPVDGTGGSTPSITFVANMTNPLEGDGEFVLTKPASNVQGQGWSYDFSVDESMQGKRLRAKAVYAISSGTFKPATSNLDPSDLTVWFYDRCNNVLIEPSSFGFYSNSSAADFLDTTFDTAYNCKNYRLILHQGTTSASAYTMRLTAIQVGPSKINVVTPISDWSQYTPSTQGLGTLASHSVYWRRVGDTLQARGRITAGTTTAVEARIGFPPGLVSASSISSIELAGTLVQNTASSTYFGNSILVEPNVSYFTVGTQNSTTSAINKINGTFVSNGGNFSFFAEAQITGWSSSLRAYEPGDGREVSFVGYKASNESVTANVTNAAYTAVKDSHGAWTGSTFVVPVSGDYYMGGIFHHSASAAVEAYVDGVVYTRLAIPSGGDNRHGGTVIPGLKAGQILSFRFDTTGTSNANGQRFKVYIFKLGGSSIPVYLDPVIKGSYETSAGQSIGSSSNTIINFATKSSDNSGAVVTGASWRFTAPRVMTCNVNASVAFASGSWSVGQYIDIIIYKNGVSFRRLSDLVIPRAGTFVPGIISGSASVDLVTGDYWDIRVLQDSGSSKSINTSAASNYVDFTCQ